ncbi:hypothetical protein CI109_105422 [Kwoniella shandongensis]|uniref:Ketoreductase (KR) domain-containing protein n=1 Tax=Kwoniella shandongensis TaxID=1734106 RepID=A0AAJ8LN78_9TREE
MPSYGAGVMPVNPTQALSALDPSVLVGQGKVAIVIGSTIGIGAAIARLLAKTGSCRRIIVFGRNEQRGKGVVKVLEELNPSGNGLRVDWVKGDVSFIAGSKAAVNDLEAMLNGDKVDLLVTCQNGPPTGVITLNEDGDGTEFHIQALSRFIITYLFTTRHLLSPTGAKIMAVANPGLSYDKLDVNDLNLKEVEKSGTRWKVQLFLDQSKRDSTVLDSFFEEFNTRYPQYEYYHLHPSLVVTEDYQVGKFPFPFGFFASIGAKLMGWTPDGYAPHPVYILLHPEAKKELGEGKYWQSWSSVLKPSPLGAWSSNKDNREKLWAKLVKMVE